MAGFRTAAATGAPAPRQTSGRVGDSIWTTSAPSRASCWVPQVPAQACVKASTRTPAKGRLAGGAADGGVVLDAVAVTPGPISPSCSPSPGAARRNAHGACGIRAMCPGACAFRPSTSVATKYRRALSCSASRSAGMSCITPAMQRILSSPCRSSSHGRPAIASAKRSRSRV